MLGILIGVVVVVGTFGLFHDPGFGIAVPPDVLEIS